MSLTKKKILSLVKESKQINEMPMQFDSPDRPHPDYEDRLRSQETPFKKVPFPSTGRNDMNFQELLGSEAFKEALSKYKKYNGDNEIISQNSLMKIYRNLSNVLETIKRLESPHIEELEALAVNLVKRQFALPEDVLQFDAKIIQNPSEIDTEGFNHDDDNEEEENQDDPEIDFGNEFEVDDDEMLKLEKSKRRLVNATLQGASRTGQYMFHIVENELTNIIGSPNIIKLYGQMMSMNDMNYWLFPDEMVKQASKSGPQAGNEEVDRNTEPPTIYARGINFPVLVHELIKGLMEFFALQPQENEDDANYYEKVKSEDTITKEDWDLRLGVAIWFRLRKLIPVELLDDEKLEIQNYILNHIFNMPAKQYLRLMKEVMGQTEAGKRAIEGIAKDMLDIYNQVHNKVYTDDPDFENYDENGYYIDDDEENNDDIDNQTTIPKKPIKPTTNVSFDYNKEPWKLNESVEELYSQKGIDFLEYARTELKKIYGKKEGKLIDQKFYAFMKVIEKYDLKTARDLFRDFMLKYSPTFKPKNDLSKDDLTKNKMGINRSKEWFDKQQKEFDDYMKSLNKKSKKLEIPDELNESKIVKLNINYIVKKLLDL